MTIRVVVADDQRVVRDGLALMLSQLPDIELVGTADDGLTAVELAQQHTPDVVLMDVGMPNMDGVEATRRIRATAPDVEVIVLTTYADDDTVFAALRAGARGYLTKDSGADQIDQAIQRVASGQALLDPSVQAKLLDRLDRLPSAPASAIADDLPDGLTAREGEVLRLIADGRSNSEIANDLYVTEATVKTHINRIFAKIGARDRAQAVTYAYRNGVVPN